MLAGRLTHEEFVGNAIADKLAGIGASEEAALPWQEAARIAGLDALAAGVWRRLRSTLAASLEADVRIRPPREPRQHATPLQDARASTTHVLVDGKAFSCAVCRSSVSRRSLARRWLEAQCPGSADGTSRRATRSAGEGLPGPEDQLWAKGQGIHPSHEVKHIADQDVFLCLVCGFAARPTGTLRMLAKECRGEAVSSYTRKNLSDFRTGTLLHCVKAFQRREAKAHVCLAEPE